MVVVLVVLASLVFDYGRRIAGINRAEIEALQATNRTLEDEAFKLRSALAASENDLQIEKATRKLLADKHNAALLELTRLKEENAVLERLSKAKKK